MSARAQFIATGDAHRWFCELDGDWQTTSGTALSSTLGNEWGDSIPACLRGAGAVHGLSLVHYMKMLNANTINTT